MYLKSLNIINKNLIYQRILFSENNLSTFDNLGLIHILIIYLMFVHHSKYLFSNINLKSRT